MAPASSLVALFSAMTQNLQQDRADLNRLDRGDGDAGDNMAANFQIVTDTLSSAIQQGGQQADVGAALRQAAEALKHQGQGATAPIYAQGIADAAQRLQGKSSFSIDDLLPLLQGLLSGSQQASGMQPGQGSLIDVLLPGVMTYMQSKQAGDSDLQAILKAMLNLRRGANGTAASPRGFGNDSQRDTTGQIDPGAAGAASLLEGLFGALLNGALQQQSRPAPTPAPQPAQGSGGNLGDLLGQLFNDQGQAPKARRSHRR